MQDLTADVVAFFKSAVRAVRRYPRIPTNMDALLRLADLREARCTIINASGSGLAIRSSVRGSVGERVLIAVREMGDVEGEIVRLFDGGFAIKFDAPPSATGALHRFISDLRASG
jgi:hypothetical protein